MYICIELADVVANAFVELVEKKGKREILFSELTAYGTKVVEVLEQEEVQAILVVSRESQLEMLEDYTDLFEAFEKDGALGIRLRDGVDTMELWSRFCASLSLRVIKAFQSQSAKEVLGV